MKTFNLSSWNNKSFIIVCVLAFSTHSTLLFAEQKIHFSGKILKPACPLVLIEDTKVAINKEDNTCLPAKEITTEPLLSLQDKVIGYIATAHYD